MAANRSRWTLLGLLTALNAGCAVGIDPNAVDGWGSAGDAHQDGTFDHATTLDVVRVDAHGTDSGTHPDVPVGTDTGGGTCTAGATRGCYTGTASTRGVGACRDGSQSCTGGTWSATCSGQQLPAASDTCGNSIDDDCNGMVDDGCGGCTPGATQACYDGSIGTNGVGSCHGGSQTCLSTRTWSTTCSGEALPMAEVCGNGLDDNCDGTVDDGCTASDPCSVYTDCYSCTGGSTCGFCGSTGECLTGSGAGPDNGACGGFDWAWYSFDCP